MVEPKNRDILNKSKIYRWVKKQEWAPWIIIVFVLVGVFHKFIANDIPIIGKHQGKVVFPVIQEYIYTSGINSSNPRNLQYEHILSTPIGYSPYQNDLDQSRQPPLSGNHLLGTDTLGRDLAAALVHGAWKATLVGFLSISIALFLAIMIGGISGYFRGTYVRLHWLELLLYIIISLFGLFYFFTEVHTGHWFRAFLTIFITVLIWLSIRKLGTIGRKNIHIYPSIITDKLIEIREAIPGIFLLLACLTFFRQASLFNVILIIGLLSWSNMARYLRSEIMAVKAEPYILAARGLGYGHLRIFFRHILPNAIGPVLSTISFTIASAILLEASLSFLGIGIPIEEPTWGALLSEARRTRDWWMAFFPGLAIFLFLIALHNLADRFRKF